MGKMKARKIKLCVSLLGMQRMPLATITVGSFATERDWKKGTTLVCPDCGEKPKYIGSHYDCGCSFTCKTWQGLKRIVKATKEAIVKPRLLEPKEEVLADLSTMTIEEFSQYVDATRQDLGVRHVADEKSAKNLKKLVIATEKLGQVILVRYNDTYEQVIAILTLSLSGRVILKDIIPMNLVEAQETLTVNVAEVTPQELAEAERLVNMLPKAKPEDLKVEDYRTRIAEELPPSEKVMELETIIATARKAQATA